MNHLLHKTLAAAALLGSLAACTTTSPDVVQRGDAQSRQSGLQVRWNGVLLHEQDLKSLGGSTGTELHTVLFVSGSKGSRVDVAFDDYRLERRKER